MLLHQVGRAARLGPLTSPSIPSGTVSPVSRSMRIPLTPAASYSRIIPTPRRSGKKSLTSLAEAEAPEDPVAGELDEVESLDPSEDMVDHDAQILRAKRLLKPLKAAPEAASGSSESTVTFFSFPLGFLVDVFVLLHRGRPGQRGDTPEEEDHFKDDGGLWSGGCGGVSSLVLFFSYGESSSSTCSSFSKGRPKES